MAYTAPTATEFKARFSPTFDNVGDPRVEAVLAEAVDHVDTSWREADYAPAINYWTAHTLVVEGALGGDLSAIAGIQAGRPVSSFSLGDASVSFEKGGASGSGSSPYSATSYGQQYLALLMANKGGPRVINQ